MWRASRETPVWFYRIIQNTVRSVISFAHSEPSCLCLNSNMNGAVICVELIVFLTLLTMMIFAV